jgi:hypothetical protein
VIHQLLAKEEVCAVSEPKEEAFKVIDRRHFTGEGEKRPEAAEYDRQEEEAAARRAAAEQAKMPPKAQPKQSAGEAGAPAAATEKSAGPTLVPSPTEEAAQTGAEAEAGLQEQESGEPLTPTSRSFQMLIDFLTRNAAAMLGGMADPRTGQPFVDLEGAREMIDMLDALKERTTGNATKEELLLLTEVLGSLKLSFMEIQRAAAEQMMKKAGAKIKP